MLHKEAMLKEPWVLIMKFSDGEDLGYESKLWENTELLTPGLNHVFRLPGARFQARVRVAGKGGKA